MADQVAAREAGRRMDGGEDRRERGEEIGEETGGGKDAAGLVSHSPRKRLVYGANFSREAGAVEASGRDECSSCAACGALGSDSRATAAARAGDRPIRPEEKVSSGKSGEVGLEGREFGRGRSGAGARS